jgi:hypothetical protein
MKRGLKVKSGVRAPAMIDPVKWSEEWERDILRHPFFSMSMAGLPECPNRTPGDGCWYCKARGVK